MTAFMVAGYHDLYYVDRVESPSTTAISIGATGPEGIRINLSKNFQEIKGDALGPDTTVDTIAQGGNCLVEFVLQEINLTQARKFIAPARVADVQTDKPAQQELGLTGHLGSSIYGQLYAIPRLLTPAAEAHGGTKTTREFRGHVINDIGETLDSTHNIIPIQFLCLPFIDGTGNTSWWDFVSGITVS